MLYQLVAGDVRGPFTKIPTWISDHMSSKVWDEIAYTLPNFNGGAIEDWE